MATFKIGKVLVSSLFKKPATLMYPVVPREWQERTRGHVEIDVTSCITCGICQRKCPVNAITVDRGARTWEIQRMQCVQCGACVDNCPKKCLTMKPEYTTPSGEKTIDLFNIPEAPKPAAAPAAEGGSASADTAGGLKCDTESCVFCGLCMRTCPCSAITVDRAEKKWVVDKDACVQCGACVEKCPKKCLVIE